MKNKISAKGHSHEEFRNDRLYLSKVTKKSQESHDDQRDKIKPKKNIYDYHNFQLIMQKAPMAFGQ